MRSATSRLTTTVGAAHLKEDISVDSGMDLARIYQYLDETRGSLFVQNTVQNFHNRDYPTKSAHAFFASLGPVLRARGAGRGLRLNSVLTTNLDDLLEQSFRLAGEPFDVVSYISQGSEKEKGRLLYRPHAGKSEVLKTLAQVKRAGQSESTLIVKLHGGADRIDSNRRYMVLSEDDYVGYFGSAALTELIPELIRSRVGTGRFLFLGYSPYCPKIGSKMADVECVGVSGPVDRRNRLPVDPARAGRGHRVPAGREPRLAGAAAGKTAATE